MGILGIFANKAESHGLQKEGKDAIAWQKTGRTTAMDQVTVFVSGKQTQTAAMHCWEVFFF